MTCRIASMVAMLALAVVFACPSRGAADDEISPELKAIFSRFNDDVKSKTSATRISAYKSIGELGAKGKPVCRQLCQGMLDQVVAVATAAADSLKKVDESIYKLALAITLNKSYREIATAGRLGKAGEPLTPLILKLSAENAAVGSFAEATDYTGPIGTRTARLEARSNLDICVTTLALIAPSDPDVNKAIINMLLNPSAQLRASAVRNVGPMTNKKLALANVIKLAVNIKEESETRVGAVNHVPGLTDENTKAGAKKSLESIRFDTDPKVRAAVDSALKKLE